MRFRPAMRPVGVGAAVEAV